MKRLIAISITDVLALSTLNTALFQGKANKAVERPWWMAKIDNIDADMLLQFKDLKGLYGQPLLQLANFDILWKKEFVEIKKVLLNKMKLYNKITKSMISMLKKDSDPKVFSLFLNYRINTASEIKMLDEYIRDTIKKNKEQPPYLIRFLRKYKSAMKDADFEVLSDKEVKELKSKLKKKLDAEFTLQMNEDGMLSEELDYQKAENKKLDKKLNAKHAKKKGNYSFPASMISP